MENSPKKIILFNNAERDPGLEMTRRVGEMLEKRGRSAVICTVFDKDSRSSAQPADAKNAELKNELLTAEMIITFGGDGTILHAARSAADFGVPILGVNMGGKGFMAELEVEDISLIDSALTAGYKTEYRMMLDADILRNGEAICRDFALNDVVIKGENKVVDLALYGDGSMITHFTGDGVIIATPTGSTAYSMAAGGPIVEPSARNIIITPVCAHVLEAKPFVLVSDRLVSVEIAGRKNNPAYMSVDGCEPVNLQSGDIVNVRKSGRITRLVRLTDRSFYQKVSEKLGEKI